jgi:hypothetical protein
MGSLAQGVIGFQYEEDGGRCGMTSLAGLGAYLDLMEASGLGGGIDRHLAQRAACQGWTDREMVESLVLLNVAGGDCVEDLRMLETDVGLRRLLARARGRGRRLQERERARRWRRPRGRSVPSPSAVFRYLESFHDEDQEGERPEAGAFIPRPGAGLQGLRRVNAELLSFAQRHARESTATLDIDATLVPSDKREARYCYQGFPAYQPINVWWSEQELVVHSEFRDGNVPAGFEKLRVLTEALECLPSSIEQVRLRADAAGYQHDLLAFCDAGTSRFGRIEFAVGCPIEATFRAAVCEVEPRAWHALPGHGEQQWAEVCFVPSELARSKTGREYRYLAIREPLRQQVLPGIEMLTETDDPIVELGPLRYRVRALVTNAEVDGETVITWYRQRCGRSEEVHAVMKDDLAGGQLPSGRFGANAAWWAIMVLALNLHQMMKRLVLGGSWVHRRMKALRFHLICLPARLVERARTLRLRLPRGHPSFPLLLQARQRIRQLAACTR